MEDRLKNHVNLLIERYPKLEDCREDIIKAFEVMEEAFLQDHKLLIAGNGGSAADSEHIAGELMKRFKTPRPVPKHFAEKLKAVDEIRGKELAQKLYNNGDWITLENYFGITSKYSD